MPLHNRSKDGSHGFVVKFINGQSIEVAKESSGYGVSASTWLLREMVLSKKCNIILPRCK